MSASAVQAGSEHRIRYGDKIIHFDLRVQADREVQRLSIHVEPDGRVLVDTPPGVPHAAVLSAVRKRSRWISQHVDAARGRRTNLAPREYVSGESLLYLGRRYRLKVVVQQEAREGTSMRGSFVVVTVPDRSADGVRKALEAWYRLRAREVLAQRLAAVAEPLRWVRHLPATRLQFMTVQWGSCSPAGRITLNPWLVKAPRQCIDYVLLHELSHLLHHNHSSKFYRTLDRQMPNWRDVKTKLDDMAEDVFRV
ncbi:MAG: M48 family metallopeptidase [Burkholderiaceae bacterium]|nr:M48 family metallopeptidase [Burkholderiaceae bacterium]